MAADVVFGEFYINMQNENELNKWIAEKHAVNKTENLINIVEKRTCHIMQSTQSKITSKP